MALFGRKKPSLRDSLSPEMQMMFDVIIVMALHKHDTPPLRGTKQYEEEFRLLAAGFDGWMGAGGSLDDWRRQYLNDEPFARHMATLKRLRS